MIVPGRTYIHHRGEKYTVLHVIEDATNTREGNKVVVYYSLTYGKVYCRDLDEFIGMVKWPDGKKRSRFVLEK